MNGKSLAELSKEIDPKNCSCSIGKLFIGMTFSGPNKSEKGAETGILQKFSCICCYTPHVLTDKGFRRIVDKF